MIQQNKPDLNVKLTPAQKVFISHFSKKYGSDWFTVQPYRTRQVAERLVEKNILERSYDRVFGHYIYRFIEAGKTKTTPAAIPAAPTITVDDYPYAHVDERRNRTAPPINLGTVKVEAHTGARGLGSVNRLWQLLQERLVEAEAILPADELEAIKGKFNYATMKIRTWERNSAMLDALREAMNMMPCDVCKQVKTNVVTEHMDEADSFSICADCRARRDDINASIYLPDPKIYTPDYNGWLDLVVAHADPSIQTIHFVRDEDRSYYAFASEAVIVRDIIAAIPTDSTGLELKPIDIIPVEINDDGDTVDRLVLNDWTPRKVVTFNTCMIALRAAGYRIVVADGEKVMKYNPEPLPEPKLHDGDEVFYSRDTYKIKGTAVRKADGYWYHLASKYHTEFAPESKIKLFSPNPDRWIGHYALMTVRGHQEGRAKPSQEKVVVVEMQAGFATIRRGSTHNRIHFCNLTLLNELAAPEELAAPAPTWELARINRGQSEGVR